MNKNKGIVFPHQYTSITGDGMESVSGGVSISLTGLLDFITYLLGGLDLSFGSKNSQVNTDTYATATQASSSAVAGRGAGSKGVSTIATHSNVDTATSGRYMDIDANFNLGSFFSAFLNIFR